jgi:hypothetical protein
MLIHFNRMKILLATSMLVKDPLPTVHLLDLRNKESMILLCASRLDSGTTGQASSCSVSIACFRWFLMLHLSDDG